MVYLGFGFLPLGEPIGLPIDESLGHENLSGGAVRTREPWIWLPLPGNLSWGCDWVVYLGSGFLPLGEPIGLPIDESLGYENRSGGVDSNTRPLDLVSIP